MYYYTANLTLIATSLKKVINYINKDFNDLNYLTISSENHTFATNTINYVQNKIIEDIKTIKPNYCYILPDGTVIENADKSNFVVISNITNFNNFKLGLPLFTVSLALIRDNQELAGAVLQPLQNNLYLGEHNKGSYCNKIRLKSSHENLTSKTLTIATNNPYALASKLHKHKVFVSNCPSLDLCYLATNKVNACIYPEPLNYFDILPALIVVKNAGFNVTYNKNGNIITNLTVANGVIKEDLGLPLT